MTTFIEIITCCLGWRERRDDGHVGHWAVHYDHGPEEEIMVKLYRCKWNGHHRLSIKVRKSRIFIWEPWPHITLIESWFVECSASHTRRKSTKLLTSRLEYSILSMPASAQKSFCEAASITKPFGHFSCPVTIVSTWLLLSNLPRAILGVVPQSVQYIILESEQMVQMHLFQ